MSEAKKLTREEVKVLSLEEKILEQDSTKTEPPIGGTKIEPHMVSAAVKLGEHIEEQIREAQQGIEKAQNDINKAQERIEVLKEMTAVHHGLLTEIKYDSSDQSRAEIYEHTGFFKNLFSPLNFFFFRNVTARPSQRESISPNTSGSEKKKDLLPLAEGLIDYIYESVPEQKYHFESRDEAFILRRAKDLKSTAETFREKILLYLVERGEKTENTTLDLAQSWADYFSSALIYGRQNALVHFLNYVEGKTPLDYKSERINTFLKKMEEKYDQMRV